MQQQQRGMVESESRKHGMLDKIPHVYLFTSLSACLYMLRLVQRRAYGI